MKQTFAFDIYGTLINTHGVVEQLHEYLESASRARSFAALWRDKQLEYAYRRGLMRDYHPFSACTQNALDYANARLRTHLTDSQKQHLLLLYKQLPAFDDVRAALDTLVTDAPHIAIYALTNGEAQAVCGLLQTAGIYHYFRDIVSVEEIQTFKPDPAVYRHFQTRSQSALAHTWLISSNPFDILGAAHCGWQTAWICRDKTQPFDTWNTLHTPTQTFNNLNELAQHFL